MEFIIEIIKHTIEITSLVFVMMLIIEYINVLTSGEWQTRLGRSTWLQYIIAGILGATPGCLGAFMVGTMFTHRIVSLGALITAMIATVGDEAFLMIAMVPGDAFVLFGVLIVIGIVFGIIVDYIVKYLKIEQNQRCEGMESHVQEHCNCYPKGKILSQLKNLSLARGILCAMIILFVFYHIFGDTEQHGWGWLKITIMVTMGIALFIVLTVPDHFLKEHLWDHIVTEHVPRIFIWTFSALMLLHLLIEHLGLETIRQDGSFIMAGIAGLVGLIPESGPHIFFTTSYSKGLIPVSILLVNSIVQDGHGMLPVLASSRKNFILVKLIKLVIGLLIGGILLLAGY